jgi:hypothetical protein
MYLVADGGTPLWASGEFWVGVPLGVFLITFGFVVLVAVIRARPEDIPRVLAIFIAVAARRPWRAGSEIESLITGDLRRDPPGTPGTLRDGRES